MALDTNAGFMLRVLEHILMTWPALQPEHKVFNDAIRDLQTESMVELQRLAAKMPDHLLVRSSLLWSWTHGLTLCLQDVYDQLETKVKEMIASGTLDEKRQIAYQNFLFIIMCVFSLPRDTQMKSNHVILATEQPVSTRALGCPVSLPL